MQASLDGTVAMVDTAHTNVLHHFKSVESEILCLAKVGPVLMSGLYMIYVWYV
jgi:hypothetical protein